MLELIYVVGLSLVLGYQAGKAGNKVELAEQGGYCIQNSHREDNCFKVNKVDSQNLEKALKKYN